MECSVVCAHRLEEIQTARVCSVGRSLASQECRRVKSDLWHSMFGRSRFSRGPGDGTGVEPSNFKIGLGVWSGIAGADGANFEIGTPDPLIGGQTVRVGLVGYLIKVPVKKGFGD